MCPCTFKFSFLVEILDFGYPQKTDSGILKTYITQQGIRSTVRMYNINIDIVINRLHARVSGGLSFNERNLGRG